MARFKLFIEYEGTRYSGWQIQTNARTVQGEISVAMRTLFKTDEIEFSGSGRTDAGVHALQQVAHLDVETMLAPEVIRMKLNDVLPADINIIEVEKTAKHFDARHDAVARSYLYQISRRRTALGKRFVWWIKEDLDFAHMQRAAGLFVGFKDFQSFTVDDPEEKSTKVHVEELELTEAGALIPFRISGSHFIWKMVRQIVGVIAEVGKGKLSIEEVEELFTRRSDRPARLTAPASGLCLERVYYKGDVRDQPLIPLMNISPRPASRK
jgi:tRNA pseudouridine38-40 synthase